ncbi:unnamed protein product [Spodoptera exigua]|nr:unnamed protein product [Spodoptera exigua]
MCATITEAAQLIIYKIQMTIVDNIWPGSANEQADYLMDWEPSGRNGHLSTPAHVLGVRRIYHHSSSDQGLQYIISFTFVMSANRPPQTGPYIDLMFSRGCGISAMRHRDLGPQQEKERFVSNNRYFEAIRTRTAPLTLWMGKLSYCVSIPARNNSSYNPQRVVLVFNVLVMMLRVKHNLTLRIRMIWSTQKLTNLLPAQCAYKGLFLCYSSANEQTDNLISRVKRNKVPWPWSEAGKGNATGFLVSKSLALHHAIAREVPCLPYYWISPATVSAGLRTASKGSSPPDQNQTREYLRTLMESLINKYTYNMYLNKYEASSCQLQLIQHGLINQALS